jgi:hypothetical protein
MMRWVMGECALIWAWYRLKKMSDKPYYTWLVIHCMYYESRTPFLLCAIIFYRARSGMYHHCVTARVIATTPLLQGIDSIREHTTICRDTESYPVPWEQGMRKRTHIPSQISDDGFLEYHTYTRQRVIHTGYQLYLSIEGLSRSPLHEGFVILEERIQFQSFCILVSQLQELSMEHNVIFKVTIRVKNQWKRTPICVARGENFGIIALYRVGN